MRRFRYKESIPVDYNAQGYIYFLCINYEKLPAEMKRLIRETARKAGGEYSRALLEFVTTAHGSAEICTKHYLCERTLWRAVQDFYVEFEKTL